MATPYYSDGTVALYHGDCRDVLPTLGRFHCCVTDPPYGETALVWDRWPAGWPALVAEHTSSLWCFGSMRMFLDRRDEFTGWRLSQDVVWEKHNGSGFATDRFKRVHEVVTHWYHGKWDVAHQAVPRVPVSPGTPKVNGIRATRDRAVHMHEIAAVNYHDDGTRLARSVLRVRSLHGRALHPTEKPAALLDLLIRYACPPGGTVLDPFAGSGSTAVAARLSGRKAVLIEADERYCEAAARRLQQGVLPLEVG